MSVVSLFYFSFFDNTLESNIIPGVVTCYSYFPRPIAAASDKVDQLLAHEGIGIAANIYVLEGYSRNPPYIY